MQIAYTRASTTVNKSKMLNLACFAFLFLFPGFFFYHTLIGIGAMRALLGGYFAVVSILFFIPFAYAYCNTVKAAEYQVASTDIQFGFFLAYFLTVVAINAAFGADVVTVKSHLLSVLYFVNIYLIFKNIDFSDPKTIGFAVVSLLLMSAIIFFSSSGGTFQLGQRGALKDPESVATYQGFARSYALTFVAVICFTKSGWLRLTLYVIAVAAMFLNSSRSELIAVLFALPIIEIYRARNALHIFFIVLSIIILVVVGPQGVMTHLPENRVWELFDLSHSESASSRYNLTQRALQTIVEHPVLGAYASYPSGAYSHNILSAWVDLGLFGFAYLFFMLMAATVKLFAQGWLLKVRSSQFLLACSLMCMSLLLLFTAKTFDDMFAGAAMGAYANYRARSN